MYMSEEIETLLGVWAVSLRVSSDMYGARRRRRFFDAHAFLQRAGRVEDVLVPLALVSLIKTRLNLFYAAKFFSIMTYLLVPADFEPCCTRVDPHPVSFFWWGLF